MNQHVSSFIAVGIWVALIGVLGPHPLPAQTLDIELLDLTCPFDRPFVFCFPEDYSDDPEASLRLGERVAKVRPEVGKRGVEGFALELGGFTWSYATPGAQTGIFHGVRGSSWREGDDDPFSNLNTRQGGCYERASFEILEVLVNAENRLLQFGADLDQLCGGASANSYLLRVCHGCRSELFDRAWLPSVEWSVTDPEVESPRNGETRHRVTINSLADPVADSAAPVANFLLALRMDGDVIPTVSIPNGTCEITESSDGFNTIKNQDINPKIAVDCTLGPLAPGGSIDVDVVLRYETHGTRDVALTLLADDFSVLPRSNRAWIRADVQLPDSNTDGVATGSGSSQVTSTGPGTVTATMRSMVDLTSATVTYDISIENKGAHTQRDNPGDELFLQGSDRVRFLSHDSKASGGRIQAAGRTVNWNGEI
ncbi:MAG: hypothetical protein AAGD38_24915, partial [Acidobacteriota bacterium]